jgi:LacI family transcriptional regulator
MKKITLKYIAKELNIAPSTVSKALNGYSDVSANTKKKVVDLAKSLNFSPNTQAAFLRTRESKIIGVVIPHISHPFFVNVVKGILDSAEKKGYLIIVLKSNESYDLEKKLIEKLLKQNVDGVFISLAQDTYDLKHLEAVKKAGVVLIQYDKISKILESSKVVVDDRNSGYLATEHLIKNGCRNIVHFRGPLLPQVSIDRFLGYKNALEDYNLIFDPKKVITSNKMTDKEGFRLMNDFISKKIDFDGIFSMSDYTAIGALESLKKHNLLVPDDIKVVGFSNWLLTDKLTPSLSTVNQPGVLMGNKCFELFLKEVNSKKKKIKFKYEKKYLKQI